MRKYLRRMLVATLTLMLVLTAAMPAANALVYGSIDRYADHSVRIWEDGSAFITAGSRVRFLMAENRNNALKKLKVKAYSSSKPAVASVSSKGWVKALKSGTARIKLKASDGRKYTMKLTVVKSNVPKSIYFKQDALTVYTGVKTELGKQLKAKPVTGLLALNKVKWKSSDKKVATVNKLGVLTPKKAGTVKITATCGKLKATVRVTVKKSKLKWID